MRTSSIALALGVVLCSSTAFAGRGGSTTAIITAVQSGSVDAIIAEIERAEELACLSCIQPVVDLVDHPSARVRDVAGWWISRRGVRTQVIASMTARLSGGDPVAARNAADVLGGMRDYNTLAALTAYLAHPLDEDSGAAAARAIGAIGHPSSATALTAALGSPLAGVRAASLVAMRTLRAMPGQKTALGATALLPALTDSDVNVRREAANTCGFLQDKAAVSALVTVLGNDSSPVVRKAAAWALGEIGDASAASALSAATNDTDPLVRSISVAALGRLAH